MGRLNSLTFAANKTHVVIFTNKHKNARFPKLHMNGVELAFTNTVKYLGVTLYAKLSFKQHLTLQCKKATYILMAAKAAFGKLGANACSYKMDI